MTKVYFKERQRYNNKLVYLCLGTIGLFSAIGGVKSLLIAESGFLETLALFTISFASGAAIWWLHRLKLKVTISDKRIKLKMSPLPVTKRSIFWEEVEQCKIVTTSEAAQWSGGNITFNHEKRYSFNGRNGLSITTKNGDHFFVGCKNLKNLKHALDKLRLS